MTDAKAWAILAAILWVGPRIVACGAGDSQQAPREAPRLLLNQRRLSLLLKERDRSSVRWQALEGAVRSKVAFREPALALALYGLVAGSASACEEALRLTKTNQADARQAALALSWCEGLASENALESVAETLLRWRSKTAGDGDLPEVRTRLLAALALRERHPEVAEEEVRFITDKWWGMRAARRPLIEVDERFGEQILSLCELFHLIRDGAGIDLREATDAGLVNLPLVLLHSFPPTPQAYPEGDYFVPAVPLGAGSGLREAVLARAAGFCWIAYDGSSQASQFLQGFLNQDRFMMRDPMGVVYEFLWANPYQPGLSYRHAPLYIHSPLLGVLFLRSSWEPNATWVASIRGEVREVGGSATAGGANWRAARALQFGGALVELVKQLPTPRIQLEKVRAIFFVGLKPAETYTLEAAGLPARPVQADCGGIVAAYFDERVPAWVRLR